MAIVKLSGTVEIGNVDQILTVQNPKGAKLGELRFSKGSVEWWPKGNSVNAHKFKWKDFAAILENNSAPVRVGPPRRGAAKKRANATPAGAKGTAKPTVKRNGRTKPDTKA
ncbi:hypothetical protein SNK19_21240 [Ralstonia pseudosolanacearum]|uniref:hypothetical protein n=1 Tax=Ralstonia pseudosolanacearum TaxID=1310165 RepID=UPI003CF186F2